MTAHCPKCNRYIAKLHSTITEVRQNDYVPLVIWEARGQCKEHGAVTVKNDHCWICEWFGAHWDAWEWGETPF